MIIFPSLCSCSITIIMPGADQVLEEKTQEAHSLGQKINLWYNKCHSGDGSFSWRILWFNPSTGQLSLLLPLSSLHKHLTK